MNLGNDLYFAVSKSGLIKIGRSSSVALRMDELRCPSGGKVRLVALLRGMGTYEQTVHRFVKAAAIGGEWFHPTAVVMEVTRQRSGTELLALMGVKRKITAPHSGGANQNDENDLMYADNMITEGRKLRARVLARIRQRTWRNRVKDGRDGTT